MAVRRSRVNRGPLLGMRTAADSDPKKTPAGSLDTLLEKPFAA